MKIKRHSPKAEKLKAKKGLINKTAYIGEIPFHLGHSRAMRGAVQDLALHSYMCPKLGPPEVVNFKHTTATGADGFRSC